MRNVWLVRPIMEKNSFVNQFRAHKMIAFDVRDTTKLSLEDFKAEPEYEGMTHEELRELLSHAPYNFDSNRAGNWVPQIDAFINKMAIGDLVLVPSKSTIFFARITGDCCYKKEMARLFSSDNTQSTMGFPPRYRRSVEWLGQVPRKELSEELRQVLKNHRVIGNLSKFYDEIDARSKGLAYEPKKEPIKVTFPLRPNFEVTYTVPSDMTVAEAEKLSAHFKTVFFRL